MASFERSPWRIAWVVVALAGAVFIATVIAMFQRSPSLPWLLVLEHHSISLAHCHTDRTGAGPWVRGCVTRRDWTVSEWFDVDRDGRWDYNIYWASGITRLCERHESSGWVQAGVAECESAREGYIRR